MTSRLPIAAAVAALLAAAVSGCGGSASGPRDVILLSVDTLRPDRLGCYGCPEARTPFWDSLARRGAQFREALAPAPFTLPSHASLLTGDDPPAHGARANGSRALAPSGPSLAESLRDAGFRCGAFMASTVLDSTSGLAPGFEVYEWQDHPGQSERPAEAVTRSALDWLAGVGDARAFLFLHLYDPHDPYEAPAPWDGIGADPYDEEIAAADRALVGAFRSIRELRGSDALIVAVSDHGEAFGEHREEGHGFFVYETTLRIPMVLQSPGAFGGGTVRSDIARTVDVRPTVLRALGLRAPDADGAVATAASGRPLQDGGAPDYLYGESFEAALRHDASDLRAYRRGAWKYIRAPREELYDLEADPGELVNLFADQPQRAREMQAGLRELLGDDLESPRGLAGAAPLDAARIAELEALGYVGSAALAEDWQSARDPKDLVGIAGLLDQVEAVERSRDWDAVLDLAARIQAIDPRNATGWRLRARERFVRGTAEEGLAVWRAAVEAEPDAAPLWARYGAALARREMPDEARSALRRSVELDGRALGVRMQLANLAARTGRPGTAWKQIDAVLALDPDHAGARRLAAQLESRGARRPQERP